MFNTLISTQQTAALLANDSDLVVLDCRFNLAAPSAGRKAYEEGHIPHAQYVDLNTDLSGEKWTTADGAFRGRNPLPNRETLAARFGSWGVRSTSQIIAYDDSDGVFAARLWWLARWLGHANVAVLDGQIQAWIRDKGALCQAPCTQEATDFHAAHPLARSVHVHEVVQNLHTQESGLIDARPADRFAGRNEVLDARAGHIPGATNRPHKANLDANGQFKSAEQLRTELFLSVRNPARTICYCGSGAAACHNLLAMEIAGLHGAALYPGSWSEWASDANRPAEP